MWYESGYLIVVSQNSSTLTSRIVRIYIVTPAKIFTMFTNFTIPLKTANTTIIIQSNQTYFVMYNNLR